MVMTVRRRIIVGPNPPSSPDVWEADYTDDEEPTIIKKSAKVKKLKRPKPNKVEQ